MTRQSSTDTVIENINMILEKLMWNVPRLSKESGVPKKTIYSILDKTRKDPRLDTIDQIASGFGLTGLHLQQPGLNFELAKSGELDLIIEKYSSPTTAPATRNYIKEVLKRENNNDKAA